MPDSEQQEFSFKKLFVPLTTLKAIHFIIIIGFIVFGNALFNEFVWDDKKYILENVDVHKISLSKFVSETLFNTAGNYRPIPQLYYSIIYSISKDITFFYHFSQLIIHITNTVLIFLLFKKFFSRKISLFLSLVFLVHPIQVEAVSYIAMTSSPLFFLFGISALLLSFKDKLSINRVILISLLLLLSILTRETGILFFLVILAYRFIFNKKSKLATFIGGVCVGVIYFILRFLITQVYLQKLELLPIARLTLWERILNIPAIAFYYLKTFFFPKELVISQHWVVKNIDFPNFYLPLFFVVLFILFLGFVGLLLRKQEQKFRVYLLFLVWFTVGLLLHLQIFPLNMTVSDHWFYFPMVGLLGIIGISLQSINFAKIPVKNAVSIFAIIIVVSLSVRTIVRNTNWRNGITLYSHDRQIQISFDLENNLGTEYARKKQYKEALTHYKNSAEIFPTELTIYNIGVMYGQLGNVAKEKEYYLRALSTKHYVPIQHKHLPYTYSNLIIIYLKEENYEEVRKLAKIAIEDYPDHPRFYPWLAYAEYNLGNYEAALSSAEMAIKIAPTNEAKYIFNRIRNREQIILK